MKNSITKVLYLGILMLCSIGAIAQTGNTKQNSKARPQREVTVPSFGPAPVTNQNMNSNTSINLKGEYSEALICFNQDLSHFTLNDPEGAISYGVTAPKFVNTGEYYNNQYYYSIFSTGLFGTINPVTGTYSQIASGCPFGGIAYNPVDGQMYGISLGENATLYTIDVTTGAATEVIGFAEGFTLGMAIDNDGRFFVINTAINGISELNPETGAYINNWEAGFTVNYGQDLSCDRETNTIYWAAYNADGGGGQLYSLNTTNGLLSLIGLFKAQASCFAIQTEYNPDKASAPTNFTIVPDPDDGLSATISWTNPSTTLGGSTLTDMQSIILKRDGEIIQEYNNPSIGANLSHVDNVPSAGTYIYTAYAVTPEGNGMTAGASAVIGPLCTITVYGHDSWNDGWNHASIRFENIDGTYYNSFTVIHQETTMEISMPSNTIINCVWISGVYDEDVDAISITNQSGTLLYSGTAAPSAGIFCTFSNNCSESVPNVPTNFSVTPDPDHNLLATVSWTNPSTCINGNPANLTSVSVLRDGIIIYTNDNPVSGGNETFTDNTMTNPSIYSYSVYASNDAGISDLITADAFIGEVYQTQHGQTVEITTCASIIYDNGGADNYLPYSNDILIINPATSGTFAFISGTYSIETDWDFLYVYDGAGINGNLLGTYSSTYGGIIEEMSTTGPLTLYFTSDESYQYSGFVLRSNCITEASVSGTVTDLESGAPIEGAIITFTGFDGSSVYSDANGNYSIDLYTDIYDITIEAEGYNTINDNNFVITDNITGNDYSMTAPSLEVTPAAVNMSCEYMGEARENVTITNNGNGPLTWNFKRVIASGKDSTFTKDENSDALIAFSTQINKFVLGNPAGAVAIGTGPEFMNSGEYVDGTWYFSTSASGYFGTINYTTGETNIITSGNQFSAIAYNQVNGKMYGISTGNNAILYTVDMETGAYLPIVTLTSSNYILGMTINVEGRFFLIDATIDGLSELNPETGDIINSWPAGFVVNYGQDIACDRTENEIYWAALNASVGEGQLYHFDPEGGDYTLIGNFVTQASCFAIKGRGGIAPAWLSCEPTNGIVEAGQSVTVELIGNGALAPGNYTGACLFKSSNPYVGEVEVNVEFTVEDSGCPSPNNLTATYGETYQDVILNWDAPSEPGTYIYNIYSNENSQIVLASEITGTTYLFTSLSIGLHSYVVRTICEDGGISTPTDLIEIESSYCDPADMCDINIYMYDSFGDGWNGGEINILIDGLLVGSVGMPSGSSGMEMIHVCQGITEFEWISGIMDYECSFTIEYAGGALIYQSDGTPQGGIFYSFNNLCEINAIDGLIDDNCNIYPNPANTEIIIEGDNIDAVVIYNVFGQLVESARETVINTTAYANGVYMILVKKVTGEISSHKIIVRH